MAHGSLTITEAKWAEGMSLGPSSLSFLAPEEWRDFGLQWGRALRSIMWLGGDWYNAGAKFGPLRRRIIEGRKWRAAGGPTYDDCKHYGSLARRFPERWRRLHPSPSFYQAVRRLPDAVALSMLKQAAKEKWTLRRIRREAGRQRNKYVPTGPSIDVSLETLITDGKCFRVALIDPPWRDAIGDGGHERGSHGKHYADMSFDELAALPVDQVVTEDGYILLWCPTVLLKDGIALLEAWRAEYMTALIWVKDGNYGTGFYVRTRAELLLIGVRPKSRPWLNKPDQVITAPRGRHSEKPPVHDLVAAAVGDGPFLEMFARRLVPGWTVIGNEIGKPSHDEVPIPGVADPLACKAAITSISTLGCELDRRSRPRQNQRFITGGKGTKARPANFVGVEQGTKRLVQRKRRLLN